MKIQTFSMGQNFTNCYVVFDESTKAGFCVDVCDRISDDYFDFIKNNHIQVEYLLLTHGHFDHTLDILSFLKQFPDTKIIISKTDYQNILNATPVFCSPEAFCKPHEFACDGTELPFCGDAVTVIATPGHTDGSVCYRFGSMLFCGDTVFAGSVGRTDLPTGSMMQLMRSIHTIKQLGDLTLYPGHMGESTIASEMKYNPFFQ